MKILFIVNVDWFFLSHRLPIAIEAKRNGFEVHIATTITSLSNKKEILNNGFYLHKLEFDRNGKKFHKLVKVSFDIFHLLLNIKPDILHLVTIQPIIMGGIAAKILGSRRVVYAISGLGHAFLSETILSSIRRFIIINLYRLALSTNNRFVIFQNLSDFSLLSKVCSLSKSESIILPGSGVDLKKFTYSELPESSPIILMASRLLISKGVKEFIGAAKILKKKGFKIKFQLVGKPDKANPLAISENEISEWVENGYIEYLGQRNDMHKIIPKSHILVLPSYYPEGLPKIVCEAAACGRAVITTNQPGCRDAIEEGRTGLLINARSSIELSEAIFSLVNNKNKLSLMSENARHRAEKLFNIIDIVGEHIKIYKYLSNLDYQK